MGLRFSSINLCNFMNPICNRTLWYYHLFLISSAITLSTRSYPLMGILLPKPHQCHGPFMNFLGIEKPIAKTYSVTPLFTNRLSPYSTIHLFRIYYYLSLSNNLNLFLIQSNNFKYIPSRKLGFLSLPLI